MIDGNDRWTLWENVGGRYQLVHENATFNHTLGFLYRAQRFGQATLNVFDIQRTLRQDSGCRVRARLAIRNDWAKEWRSREIAREAFHVMDTAGTYD